MKATPLHPVTDRFPGRRFLFPAHQFLTVKDYGGRRTAQGAAMKNHKGHHLSRIRAVKDLLRSSDGFELFDSSLLPDNYCISVAKLVFDPLSISGTLFSA
jgi:hypothetical protein